MESLQTYTACVVQSVPRWVYKRGDLQGNLDRALLIADSAARRFGGWAPLKLIAYPEFFLQGYTGRADIDMQVYRDEILITLPGPESDLLAKKAREHQVYLLGACLEFDPKLPEYFFNCAFIISPEGEIIHKYRKAIPQIASEMAMSPHDLLDRYMEVFGNGKSVLETVFPVTDTPLGRIGTFICMDGHFPEVTRAMAMQGAEILVRPTAFPEPLVSSPTNIWELQNRLRAHENMSYVLAPNTGGQLTDELPFGFTPGDSMIVDYNGLVVGRAPYPGESVVTAEINLQSLRGKRMDPRRNFLAQIRTELFDGMYRDPVYPANRFQEKPIERRGDVLLRSPASVIEAFVEKRIYTKPR